jgi:hypothetical protein
MLWESVVGSLLGKVAPKVADYYTKKIELKAQIEVETLKGKIAWQQALTRRASESEGRDHEWEIESIRNSGFKDEWVLFMLSIPMVMSFIPGLVVYVQMGFSALSQTPEWYRWLILLIFTAIYGIRIWRRDVMPKP